MTLREIEPLNEKDWDALTEDVEKGQTPEQAKALAIALESENEIPTVEF